MTPSKHYKRNFPANLLTGIKHPDFSTNQLADTNNAKHNHNCRTILKPKQQDKKTSTHKKLTLQTINII